MRQIFIHNLYTGLQNFLVEGDGRGVVWGCYIININVYRHTHFGKKFFFPFFFFEDNYYFNNKVTNCKSQVHACSAFIKSHHLHAQIISALHFRWYIHDMKWCYMIRFHTIFGQKMSQFFDAMLKWEKNAGHFTKAYIILLLILKDTMYLKSKKIIENGLYRVHGCNHVYLFFSKEAITRKSYEKSTWKWVWVADMFWKYIRTVTN